MSQPQAIIHTLSLKTDSEKALELIKKGATFSDIAGSFPNAKTTRNLYVILTRYKNDGELKDKYRALTPSGHYAKQFTTNRGRFIDLSKGQWVYDLSKDKLTAFYLTEDAKSQRLPQKYALMIGYADCMIDTTTQTYSDEAIKSQYNWDPNSAALEFIRKFRLKGEGPKKADFENLDDYYSAVSDFNKKAVDHIDLSLETDQDLRKRLLETTEKSLQDGGSTDYFEYLTEKYLSKERALALKRSRIVVGTCSMDDRPRLHALEIARLSAETTDWSIFLRSHLDLMNDNFSRASDGSYAWESRSTYIKELESLGIGVRDLLFGATLHTDHPAENHYQGSNRRTARAIVESQNPVAYVNSILEAIEDKELDLYNRMCMTYLILNYFQQSEENRTEQKRAAKAAIETLPDFVSKELLSYLD
ncbi:MAG: hypothetical protein HEP71_06910 [Roseivirga sp.]|nr:hypothetical protein [Roseivirga sp.]